MNCKNCGRRIEKRSFAGKRLYAHYYGGFILCDLGIANSKDAEPEEQK